VTTGSTSPPPPPLLTLAIAVGNKENFAALRDQLSEAGLLNQSDVQICIAHAGHEPLVPDNTVQVISCQVGTPVFRLYATIIEKTDSLYVALLDAACPPCQGWLAAAREQFRSSTDIFYGPVNSGWDRGDPRNVGYLIEYAQFRQPLDTALPEYPGNNIVFRRELLATVPEDGAGFQKTFFLRCMENELGIKPRACDDMMVMYRKSYPWTYYLHRRLRHGRLYGSSHASSLGNRRFMYAGGTLILPVLRYWRILRTARRDPHIISDVLRFSARIVVSECAWSIGECQGYLAGAARDEAFLD
jgi:hypothetical protein